MVGQGVQWTLQCDVYINCALLRTAGTTSQGGRMIVSMPAEAMGRGKKVCAEAEAEAEADMQQVK